jgi:4-alpha-glucanotransferase
VTRRSGLIVPLPSLPSRASWGLGEFPDLAWFARWAAEAGQSVLQILPVTEMPPGERSPYSAMTAMALDPIYIALPEVPDFAALGGEAALDPADRSALAAVRQSDRIRYELVRDLKSRWLRLAWDRFLSMEVARGTPRAARFDEFVARERWWLDDYALFRALHALHEEHAWSDWPDPLARRESPVVDQARRALHMEISYRRYLQWLAAEQWAEAKRLAWPTKILGDMPFMISADSADVWTRQGEFRFDATIGTPPDAFSEEGQDWGLPPCRWEAMAAGGFGWMRARARRYSALYDGFRIDHLVGYFRTYVRPLDKSRPPFFDPAHEAEQVQLGETIVSILRNPDNQPPDANTDPSWPRVIAEDLGSIPPFVRASMQRLSLAGMKVLRWERQDDLPGRPPADPRVFPELSVAATGTHDIEPLAALEEGATDERREATLRALLSARSFLALMLLQDVFGWTDRINRPGIVDDANWTWRVPWPVDTWVGRADTIARAGRLRQLTRDAGR